MKQLNNAINLEQTIYQIYTCIHFNKTNILFRFTIKYKIDIQLFFKKENMLSFYEHMQVKTQFCRFVISRTLS